MTIKMMKLACALLFVASVQATDWAKVRPVPQPQVPLFRKAHFPASNPRIIGGDNAIEGQFKYQVAVLIDGAGFCGGSLIADNVVLTAGHCVKNFAFWEVHAGALNFNNMDEEGRVIVTTSDAVLHEDYSSLPIDNDIAILRLPESVSGSNIAPVRLPARSQSTESFAYWQARASGWGKSSDESTSINPDLKFVDMRIITEDDCKAIYGALIINKNKVCCDAEGGAVSTCNGDSGGPLVVTEDDGEVTEVGVVSFGVALGCESGWPAAFTRVTEYLDWIETNSGIAIRP